jgi:hypothetical protein
VEVEVEVVEVVVVAVVVAAAVDPSNAAVHAQCAPRQI